MLEDEDGGRIDLRKSKLGLRLGGVLDEVDVNGCEWTDGRVWENWKQTPKGANNNSHDSLISVIRSRSTLIATTPTHAFSSSPPTSTVGSGAAHAVDEQSRYNRDICRLDRTMTAAVEYILLH